MQITAYMLSCGERALVRRDTVERLARTDWLEPPRVVLDAAASGRPQERQSRNARSLLERAIADGPDFLLFLEDDLEFNAYLGSNLAVWAPLAGTPSGGHFFASLYNPGVRELRREPSQAFFVADANSVYGSQAFVLSLATARHIAGHWEDVIGMQDIKMSRLAGAAGPIYYHTPSLVQHVPVPSVWGGGYHSAGDFEREWKSAAAAADSAPRSCGPLDRDAILRQMRGIDGWLDDQEAHLLMTTVAEALDRTAPQLDSALIEIGSFHGRSTTIIGLTIKALGSSEDRLYSIDPHEGEVSTLDRGVVRTGPTFASFTRNIDAAGLGGIVVPLIARAPDVAWDRQVGFLFVDRLHDYEDVQRDFAHFEPFVRSGGFVAFHDYACYFPGVQRVVDDALAGGRYRLSGLAGSLAVLEKR